MPRNLIIRRTALPLLLLLTATTARAADSVLVSDGDSDAVSYWRDIRPIFQAHCHGCHQPARADGEYVMTRFDQLLKGGESDEAAVAAGQPAASYLIEQITPDDGQAAMPKDKPALAPEQLGLVTRWIQQGARDDTPASARQQFDVDHPPSYTAPSVVTSLDFSPDGQLLAVSGYHEVLIHRADGSELVARLVGLSERIESAVFSPDGKRLAVAGGSPGRLGELQVWDVDKQQLILSVQITFDTIYGASWSPDGTLVAVGCSDNTVRAIEAATGQQVLFSGAHNDWVLDTVFSTQGNEVVSVSRDRTVKLTDVKTQRFVGNITTHTPGVVRGEMIAVDRHPSKDELLVGGTDGAPKLFRKDVKAAPAGGGNPNQIREYARLPGRVFDVAFAPGGDRFAAASSHQGSGEVRVYTVADGKIATTLQGHESGVYAVAFSPDGQTIASGGYNGYVYLHDAGTGKLVTKFLPMPLPDKTAAAGD